MNRKQLIPVVLVAGVAALAYNAIYLSRGLSPPPPSTSEFEDDEEEVAVEEETAIAPLQPVSRAALREFIDGLPDPSRNPFLTWGELLDSEKGAISGAPRISGTLIGVARRVAWIDGHAYGVGDVIGEFEVERVERNAAWIRRGDTSVELNVQASGQPTVGGATHED